ncbi:hypothetical protein [Herbaspirillum sp. NPDC087042]|uniref:hypothetical protein n=1 Tax=Herbaspirillum sp. NPDC087042 TaxID=3364004 RepID=UPI00382CFC5F
MSNHVLFFSPSAEIWEHSFPEGLVGEILAKKGSSVTMVRCRGALRPLCPAGQSAKFTAATPEEQQRELCERCHAKGRLMDDKLGLRHVELDDYIEPGDEALIIALLAKAVQLRSHLLAAEDFDQLTVQGKPVGRTALYELILRHKKNDFEFSDVIWEEYLVFLRLAAQVTLASDRLLAQSRPDRVSVYNSLYVAHRAFCLRARAAGIEQYFMHAGTNLARQHGTLMIGKDFTWGYLADLASRFDFYRDRPVSPAVIDDVTHHFLCLFGSLNSFVFSAARSGQYQNLRKRFGIGEEQKFIVASTSSYDERFAVESVNASRPSSHLLFPRILDWVRHLVELAKSRPEWFVLIRVHPREFPNRRDQVQSEHSRRMKELLTDLPPNVSVNWPDDNLSLYDLAQEADLFLNAWSSVGKEMTLLGLPVVIYSPEIVLYPTSLNYVGTTQDGYLQAIEQALADGWRLERCHQAYRWYGLEFSRSCVDLRASFAPERRYRRSLVERVLLRLVRVGVSWPQERWDLARRKTMPVADEVVNRLYGQALQTSERANDQNRFDGQVAEEMQAIRASLRRLGKELFSANPPDKPSRLQRHFAQAKLINSQNISK